MKFTASIITVLVSLSFGFAQTLANKMPADFAFSIHYGFVDDYSMFDSTFTRMGICKERNGRKEERDTTITLIIGAADKQKIYYAIITNKLLALPQEPKYDTHGLCVSSASEDLLLLRINGVEKWYYYSYECEVLDKAKAKRYQNVLNLIKAIINKRKEVINLPQSCLGFL